MTREQWQSAWKIFHSSSDLSSEKIGPFIEQASDDSEVRQAVLEMVHQDLHDSPAETEPLERIGLKIGRYVLTGRLGEETQPAALDGHGQRRKGRTDDLG